MTPDPGIFSRSPSPTTSARRPKFLWRAAVAGLLVVAGGAVVITWLRVPNDHRVNFSFPDIGNESKSVIVDFIERVRECRYLATDIVEAAGGAGLLATDPKSAGPRVVLASVEAEGQTVRRRSLLAPAGAAYVYSLTVPPAADLEFYYAVSPPKPSPTGGVRFVVELTRPDNQTQILFSTTASAAGPPTFRQRFSRRLRRWIGRDIADGPDPWEWAHLSLAPWAGQAVKLSFRTEPGSTGLLPEEPAGPDVFFPQAYWGEPVLKASPPAAAKGSAGINLILLVTDTLRWDAVVAHGNSGRLTTSHDRFLRQAMDFQRVYSNSTSREYSLASLLRSKSLTTGDVPDKNPNGGLSAEGEDGTADAASLAGALKRRGYRTAFVGNARPGIDSGFDEAHLFPPNGYGPALVSRRAVEWLTQNGRGGPFLLVVYFGNDAASAAPPPRFWASAAVESLPRSDRGRLTQRARIAYADEYLGRFLDILDAYEFWPRSLVSLVSLRGEGVDRAALAEPEIRVLWALRHRGLPEGVSVSEPVQLADAAPTLLRYLNAEVPAEFQGRNLHVAAGGFSRPEEPARILLQSDEAKGVILNYHHKYVRRKLASPQADDAESIYDLWADPAEEKNLVRRDRGLLAKVRRALEELSPDRLETRLLFWDLGDRPVRGSLETGAGEIRSFVSSGAAGRRGANFYDFEILSSSGEVRFEIWPPMASYVLRVKLKDEYFPAERIRVSRFGLPLFERSGVEWYDYNVFPWMTGLSFPQKGETGPLLFMGRCPPKKEESSRPGEVF
ncbi:MAG TPA: sulfatase-like hydrolase/transferase [Elusimicrobiota bacterium]|nr:sulfatase-like hydrolase/transferase [Elusimicrobiota bacterium]